MITVYIPPSFIPERTYAVQTLLQHYCGIDIHIIDRPGQLHYEITWDQKTIIIKDEFFGHTIVDQTYLAPDRIPGRCIECRTEELKKIIILFGHDQVDISENRILCGADLIAGAFFMLTRWEESFGLHEDLHGRYPASESLVVKSGFILRPIVDEYVALLKHWLQMLGYPLSAQKENFQVIPTCDVDLPYYWLRSPRWKVYFNEWRKHKNLQCLKTARRMIQSVEKGERQDPYDTYEYMMDEAEQAGLRIQFNMIAGGVSRFEGLYSIRDERIRKLMKSFSDRGHTIGLHPSYNSYVDHNLIREEKKALEDQLKTSIHTSRQHYLKFSVPKTWQLLSDASIKEDSTMGYAGESGFRCGTCKAFPVFDIYQRNTLPIMERPLLIMDVSLRYYKKLSVEDGLQLCDQIISEVKKHHGQLVFLWHNSNLSEAEGWSPWKRVFEYLIKGE